MRFPYPRTADVTELFNWARQLIQVLSRFNLDQGDFFLPSGMMVVFPGNDADPPPSGWLWCDGVVVSRAQYAGIFSVVGTSFNTGGEAGTDFRLPNYVTSIGGANRRWIIRI